MRPRYPMPADVEKALRAGKVMTDYRARPAYQRNDYILWIGGAKLPATRAKRIAQMVAELTRGGVYMNMPHKPSAKPVRGKKS